MYANVSPSPTNAVTWILIHCHLNSRSRSVLLPPKLCRICKNVRCTGAVTHTSGLIRPSTYNSRIFQGMMKSCYGQDRRWTPRVHRFGQLGVSSNSASAKNIFKMNYSEAQQHSHIHFLTKAASCLRNHRLFPKSHTRNVGPLRKAGKSSAIWNEYLVNGCVCKYGCPKSHAWSSFSPLLNWS